MLCSALLREALAARVAFRAAWGCKAWRTDAWYSSSSDMIQKDHRLVVEQTLPSIRYAAARCVRLTALLTSGCSLRAFLR